MGFNSAFKGLNYIGHWTIQLLHIKVQNVILCVYLTSEPPMWNRNWVGSIMNSVLDQEIYLISMNQNVPGGGKKKDTALDGRI